MHRSVALYALCLVSALTLSCGQKASDPFAGRLVDLSHAFDASRPKGDVVLFLPNGVVGAICPPVIP